MDKTDWQILFLDVEGCIWQSCTEAAAKQVLKTGKYMGQHPAKVRLRNPFLRILRNMQQSKNPQPDDVGKPTLRKTKRERPYVLECRWFRPWTKTWTDWTKWNAYHSEEAMQQALEGMSRKYPDTFEFRVKPEAAE